MRYYNLQILNTGIKEYFLDESNPYGLDVVFRIQSTSNVLDALPSTFEILNGDISLFSDTNFLQGRQVLFLAGIKNAPYLKNQNMVVLPNLNPLFFAQIDASFASWELTENRCVLAFSSARPMLEDNTFILNKGDIIATKAMLFLQQNLAKNGYTARVEIDSSATSKTFDSLGSKPFNFARDSRLQGNLIMKLARFLGEFQLAIDYQANKNLYAIYSMEKEAIRDTTIDNIIVSPSSLLSQPVWENSATVTLEMALDSRVTLGTRILIPTNIELFSDTTGFSGTILKSAVDARILKNGYYSVREVMHIGDSRNTDPKSWSTVCKCSFLS